MKDNSTALKILNLLLSHRRKLKKTDLENNEEISHIFDIQIPKIEYFIARSKKIELVLPAFPCKSPNPDKVLGILPDMAEELSLIFLDLLCQEIQHIYAPGAQVIICSDGHVFGDLINVSDENINLYQKEMQKMIDRLALKNLTIFNLSDVQKLKKYGTDYNALRNILIKEYAEPEDEIKKKLLLDSEGLELYRAIMRFLYEDSKLPSYSGSNATLQKLAKKNACGVIQRSWAWGNLLAEIYPNAIRLSIHPQSAKSAKLGIHMLPTQDDWMTPWHAVVVKDNGKYILMKHKQVKEIACAQLIQLNGNPSYYLINQ